MEPCLRIDQYYGARGHFHERQKTQKLFYDRRRIEEKQSHFRKSNSNVHSRGRNELSNTIVVLSSFYRSIFSSQIHSFVAIFGKGYQWGRGIKSLLRNDLRISWLTVVKIYVTAARTNRKNDKSRGRQKGITRFYVNEWTERTKREKIQRRM